MSAKKPAIQWIAPIVDSSGYADATRNYIYAILKSDRVDISVEGVSFEQERTAHSLDKVIKPHIRKNHAAPIQVLHLTPENFARFYKKDKYNIGYVAWETDKLPDHWVPEINRMNEVWVPSSWNQQVFRSSGVNVPVFCVPHAIPVPDTDNPKPEYPGADPNHFWFYSIGQWTSRKNHLELLTAYYTEFYNTPGVVLALKTYRRNTSPAETNIIKNDIKKLKQDLRLPQYPKLLLFANLLPDEEMVKLHLRGDCFVLAARAEGFSICCKPDTIIFTDSGAKQIDKITIGDNVLSHTGYLRKVSRTFSRFVDEDLVQITAYGTNQPISLTKEHPVLAFKRPYKKFQKGHLWHKETPIWIKAGDLEKGDCVVFPRPQQKEKNETVFDLLDYDKNLEYDNKYVWYKMGYSPKTNGLSISDIQKIYGVSKGIAEDARRKALNLQPIGRSNAKSTQIAQDIVNQEISINTSKLKVKRFIKLDKDLATFLGWYIAEGGNNAKRANSYIGLALNISETKEADLIRLLLGQIFGLESYIYKPKDTNGQSVITSSVIVGKFLDTLCGNHCLNKKIPYEVLFGDLDLLKTLLEALMAGDGYDSGKNISLTTASKTLAHDVQIAFARLGWRQTYSRTKCNRLSNNPAYIVGSSEMYRNKEHGYSAVSWHLENGQYAHLIRDIQLVRYKGLVHNLEVEIDNSYTTTGFAVHNCHAQAMATGNPTIGCRYGGALDFMNDNNSLLVDSKIRPVQGMDYMPIYNGTMNWGDPNISDLRRKMRWAFENTDQAKKLGQQARQDIINNYSHTKIGNLIADRLEAICRERGL